MAWTNPKTWSRGEKLTAAEMNTQLRDNLNHLRSGFVVESGSRPASPFIGQEIYESDTGKKFYWTGTAWYEVGTSEYMLAFPAIVSAGAVGFSTAMNLNPGWWTFTLNGYANLPTSGGSLSYQIYDNALSNFIAVGSAKASATSSVVALSAGGYREITSSRDITVRVAPISTTAELGIHLLAHSVHKVSSNV